MALVEHFKSGSAIGVSKFTTAAPKAPALVKRAAISGCNLAHKLENAGAPGVVRRAGGDVRLPCMLYAAVGAFSPHAKADTQAAIAQIRRMHGVLHVISYEQSCDTAGGSPCCAGIAVVTRGYWFSRQALVRLMAQCGGAVSMFAWNSAAEVAEADAHVTRGTAQFVDGRLHLWLATLDAPRSRARAAHVAGISQDLIELRVVGQPRSEAGRNVLVSAIAVARALQPAPVQVIVAQEFERRSEAHAVRAQASALSVPASLRIVGSKELAA